jgi:hypothetical protein
MAPTNSYLLDEAARDRLVQHNNRLVKRVSSQFAGEDEESHYDFNRAKEWELLNGFLNSFQDPDFRSGVVNVDAAAQATYGSTDDYLLGRIAKSHLYAASDFNKRTQANGQVVVVAADGATIIRVDRGSAARQNMQAILDKARAALNKAADTQGKRVHAQEKRSLKIDPTSGHDLQALTSETLDNVVQHQQQALGQGE